MDREPDLTASGRRAIRRFVTAEIAYHEHQDRNIACVMDVYRGWPTHKAYALAWWAAVDTGEPLDWPPVRDNRS